MIQVDVKEMQAELFSFVRRVQQGEVIVICDDKRPVAEMRSISAPLEAPRANARPVGLAQGMGAIHPSFFEPLPEDIQAAFEGMRE